MASLTRATTPAPHRPILWSDVAENWGPKGVLKIKDGEFGKGEKFVEMWLAEKEPREGEGRREGEVGGESWKKQRRSRVESVSGCLGLRVCWCTRVDRVEDDVGERALPAGEVGKSPDDERADAARQI